MTFKANDSLTEQIARFLGKRIILGEMTAGERIQELRIAAELDVSRGSVREALLILERRHLVTIYPRRGAVVSALDADAADEFFELWFALVEQVLVAFCHSWHSEELAPFFDIGTRLAQAQQQEDLPAYYDSAIELLEKLYVSYPSTRQLASRLQTSHTAIVARAYEIPAVVGLEKVTTEVRTGDLVIIDGTAGAVIVNPDPETIEAPLDARNLDLANEVGI